jgi:phage gp16-like protein
MSAPKYYYEKAPGKGQKISPRQIKTIHTLKGMLGMDRESYEALLQQVAQDPKVTSSKALSWREAEQLVEELQRKKDGSSTSPVKVPRKKPFEDLDGRPGMASGAQCRLLAAMWGEVSRAENAEAKTKALNKFIKRIVGVDDIRFVKGWQVEKLVKALEKMKESKEAGNVQTIDDAV